MLRRQFLRTAMASALVGAAAGQAGSATTSIRIGHSTWIGFGPLYVARDKGLYAKRGLDVQLLLIENMSDTLAAMQAGRVDGIATTFDAVVLSVGHGAELKLVVGLDESAGGDGIIARKEIVKIEDLRGKKVAAQLGAIPQFLLSKVLDKAGLSFSDIELVDMKAGDAGAAFVAGRLDAAVTWQPWLGKAQTTEFGHILIDTRSLPGLIVDGVALRSDLVASSPDQVAAFVEAYLEAMEFLKQSPDEAKQIIAAGLNMSLSSVEESWNDVKFFDAKRNREFLASSDSSVSPAVDLLNSVGDFYTRVGALKAAPKPEDLLAAQFVTKS